MRPVIIIRKFNSHLILAVPTSTQLKNNQWYVPFMYHNTTYSALISHIKTIDTKRLNKKIATLSSSEFKTLKETLQQRIFKKN